MNRAEASEATELSAVAAQAKGIEELLGRHWHHMSASQVLKLLETDADDGLDVFEVKHRCSSFGDNTLTQKKGKHPIVLFLSHFHQPLVYILLAATAVTAFLQEWVDSGVILGVVLINAVIGFLQESKAVKAIEALARTMTGEANVIRAGARKRISATGLVPGDIVLLQSGDKVPADLRLIRVRELEVDESALTGESVPVQKDGAELRLHTVLADRRNMAYSSSLVTHGTGKGVVVATGDRTELGRISEFISSAEILATPLTKQIAQFSRILLYIILAMAGLTFAVGILRDASWLEMFMAAVALAVGAIPEGLPAAVTITLAIGVGRMATRHAIVRKLPAVETLGSTTVICSDKTGTLTQNEMTVREVMAGGSIYQVSGVGYGRGGSITGPSNGPAPELNVALMECLKAGVLCNDSKLTITKERCRVEGDPTEGALICSALKAGLCEEELHARLPRIDVIPFESQHQFMATLHEGKPSERGLVYLKGSVEKILPRCDATLGAQGTREEMDVAFIERGLEEMAGRGLRVLAFARVELPARVRSLKAKDIGGGLTFLGLQAMIDPPRPEAIIAVNACQAAGIKVKMITGDHAGTAMAIARQIGINGYSDCQMSLTGKAIAELSDFDLIEVVERTAVFARVSPEQKLRLVEALQARGHVVAMTGDGVNDAPALRRADIGVAMGLTGTEAAREAAHMVLTDDNFASIEAAVEEGRGVFDNLVKFIIWTLPTNIGEGLVILAAVFAGVTLPILPVQILWINTTTAVCLGLMLAFEPKERGIMLRPPRDPRSPILTGTLRWRIASVSALLLVGAFGLFNWEMGNGATLAQARTVAVNVFVIGQVFYLFNCRSLTKSTFRLGLFTNVWLVVGVSAMIALQLLFTYVPLMNKMFETAPIGLLSWALILFLSIGIFAVIGLEKWVRLRVTARNSALRQEGSKPC